MNFKLIILIILSYNIILFSQEFSFNNYSSLDGLSSNTVHAIIQDKKGFIWLGTEEGLNRFDGYSFKVYKHEIDDSTSLSNNVIWSLAEDKEGFIWLATDRGGLDKFDPVTENFIHYKNVKGDSTSLAVNSVQYVYVDSKNTVWAGTWEGGLNKFNRESNNFTRYLNDPENPNSLSNNRIFSIIEDRKGNLWVGTDGGGISVLNIKTNKFTNYKHDPDDKNSLPGDNILSLFEDNSGKIWIGTYGYGLSIFDPEKNIFKTYKSLKDKNSISQNIIWSVYQDIRGLIWLGTLSNGITIYNPADKSFTRIHHDPLNPKSISSDYTKNMFEDRSGVLWIGSVAGGVSVGKYDFLKYIFEEQGVKEKFWKINIKPGKPIYFAVCEHDERRILVFGLPGNPVSSLVNFYVFIKPAIDYLFHQNEINFITATLQNNLKKKDGKPHFTRGILFEENGELKVSSEFSQSSGNLVEMSRANCLIEIEENKLNSKKGERVKCILI